MHTKMHYRRFGRTELRMPVLSCGGMRYQYKWSDEDPASIPPDNQANLEATVHRALELGINHIETARGYGTSEMQLGRFLPAIPRDQLIVQTKVAPVATQKEFLDTFDKSMDYLGLDHVDLLSLHGINDEEVYDMAMRKGVASKRRASSTSRGASGLSVSPRMPRGGWCSRPSSRASSPTSISTGISATT